MNGATIITNFISVTIFNNSWRTHINSQTGWQFIVMLDKSWAFDPYMISSINITINAPSSRGIPQFDALIFGFATNNAQYISAYIPMDNSGINRIYPSCESTSELPQIHGIGDIASLPRFHRKCDVADGSCSNWNHMLPINLPNQLNSFPIVFELINDPFENTLRFSFKSNAFTSTFKQECYFKGALTNRGLKVYIGGNDIGQSFIIKSMQIQSVARDVHTTTAPTNIPTRNPTTFNPTNIPTMTPTLKPTTIPTHTPTNIPTNTPTTDIPTISPTDATLTPTNPTNRPTHVPTTMRPSNNPTVSPTNIPTTRKPTHNPTKSPTYNPSTKRPTNDPTISPTSFPTTNDPTTSPTLFPTTNNPTVTPTQFPTTTPTEKPTKNPVKRPTQPKTVASPTILHRPATALNPATISTGFPTSVPSVYPTVSPTYIPSITPTNGPSRYPTISPTYIPSIPPSYIPSISPSDHPTLMPSLSPSYVPTSAPSVAPYSAPTLAPSVVPSDSPTEADTAPEPTLEPTPKPTTPKPTTSQPTLYPTFTTHIPTVFSTYIPTVIPTVIPTYIPTRYPSLTPTLIDEPTNDPNLYIMYTTAVNVIPTTFQPTLKPIEYYILMTQDDESVKEVVVIHSKASLTFSMKLVIMLAVFLTCAVFMRFAYYYIGRKPTGYGCLQTGNTHEYDKPPEFHPVTSTSVMHSHLIRVHLGDRKYNYAIREEHHIDEMIGEYASDEYHWDHATYHMFMETICDEFCLQFTPFRLYEIVDGVEEDINDIDDLIVAFDCSLSTTEAHRSIDVYIQLLDDETDVDAAEIMGISKHSIITDTSTCVRRTRTNTCTNTVDTRVSYSSTYGSALQDTLDETIRTWKKILLTTRKPKWRHKAYKKMGLVEERRGNIKKAMEYYVHALDEENDDDLEEKVIELMDINNSMSMLQKSYDQSISTSIRNPFISEQTPTSISAAVPTTTSTTNPFEYYN